jgi:hypothetical protein
MRRRCNSPTRPDYPGYGGRGITICAEWDHWPTFQQWAKDTGYAEGLTLDRIDNNGNYTPGNCRWSTQKEQQRNRRSNRAVVRSDGQVYATMIEAAEAVGAKKTAIYAVCRGKGKTARGFGWRYA